MCRSVDRRGRASPTDWQSLLPPSGSKSGAPDDQGLAHFLPSQDSGRVGRSHREPRMNEGRSRPWAEAVGRRSILRPSLRPPCGPQPPSPCQLFASSSLFQKAPRIQLANPASTASAPLAPSLPLPRLSRKTLGRAPYFQSAQKDAEDARERERERERGREQKIRALSHSLTPSPFKGGCAEGGRRREGVGERARSSPSLSPLTRGGTRKLKKS